MKMFSEAAHDADACLRLQPRHAKARFAKGRALYFLGEYESAFAQYDAGLRLSPHPKIEAWLSAERRKPEYGAMPGPVAMLERLSEAILTGDIKRLSLVLCRCPADALEQGLVRRPGTPPPLHLAASAGQVDCCVLLLQRNASADGRDASGRTPLMLALEKGHSECACALLPHCQELDATCRAGLPALHRAAARGLGAPLGLMLGRGIDVAIRDGHGRTALHAACAAGEPVIAMRLASSADAGHRCLDLADNSGCTPALLAARAAYLSPRRRAAQLQCVSACLLQGADCSAAVADVATTAAAAATAAASAVAAAAAPNDEAGTKNEPSSSVTAASTTMSAAAVAKLAEQSRRSSDLCVSAHGLLPLHFYIAALGEADLLLQLIDRLLKPPPATSQGVPRKDGTDGARGKAASETSSTTTVAARRPLDARSADGLTVLCFAAAHGQVESVRLLLAHGAAPDEPDGQGLLPSDHAVRGIPGVCLPGAGHAESHQLLMRHLAR
jgi:ankyrin repeat protein